MNGHTLYDAATGQIRAAISGDLAFAQMNRLPHEGIAAGQWSGVDWYFPDGQRKARPAFTAVTARTIRADGRHETTFSSLPDGTMLSVGRQNETRRYEPVWEPFEIDDGSFQFSTAIPGIYRLRFEAPFPYGEQDVMVTANAP